MLGLADEAFLKDAPTSIAQRDQSIRILGAHRSVNAAGDIEPIIAQLAFKAGAFAGFKIVLHLTCLLNGNHRGDGEGATGFGRRRHPSHRQSFRAVTAPSTEILTWLRARSNGGWHQLRLSVQNWLLEKPIAGGRGGLFGVRSLSTIDSHNGIAAIP
jgi:hypothetical protein